MSYDNNNGKWYSPKAEEWHNRLQQDPEYLDREYYNDRIKWYDDKISVWSSMIEEFELLYEQLPNTPLLQHNRDRLVSGIQLLRRALADIQSEYDEYKQDKEIAA